MRRPGRASTQTFLQREWRRPRFLPGHVWEEKLEEEGSFWKKTRSVGRRARLQPGSGVCSGPRRSAPLPGRGELGEAEAAAQCLSLAHESRGRGGPG